ncbi:MAG: hypothetical protein VKJ04_03075 [Vampirovibrionales bacterium]|nr:hypothetical protein [Vampirovibrionales bacterium]
MTSFPAFPNDSQSSNNRWYDQDPALKSALKQLRQAPDRYQAQIALNIIKIIVEHQIEADAQAPLQFDRPKTPTGHATWKQFFKDVFTQQSQEEAVKSLQSWMIEAGDERYGSHPDRRRRWYDVHESLSSAMQLLNDSPDELQRQLIPTIATMIEDTLSQTVPLTDEPV